MRWIIRLAEIVGSYALIFRESRRFRELRMTLSTFEANPYRNAREKTFASNRELARRHQDLRRLRLKMEFENACGKIAEEWKAGQD